LNFLYYPQFLTRESRRYYNDQINRAVEQSDHILTDSQATRNDLVKLLNVSPAKITVHTLGVDESFRPLPEQALSIYRAQLELPEDYLLFVGTFEPRKNVAGLLEAYRMLLDRLPDAPPLVLAGRRGWLFDETMARIDQMKLDDHIIWRENVSQRALPTLYNLATVLVAPSFYEGFGFPALEAMACGTVPIVSDRSSLPEVVGEVGAKIDPDDPTTLADALYHALTDSNWLAKNREAGLQRARRFTWGNTARIALSVYNAVSLCLVSTATISMSPRHHSPISARRSRRCRTRIAQCWIGSVAS